MPALLRLLARVITVLVMLAQPVTSIASAGLQGEVHCCCPDPALCECHDHKHASHDAPKMRRCGDPDVNRLVAPISLAALPPPPVPMVLATDLVSALPTLIVTVPADRVLELEKPPF